MLADCDLLSDRCKWISAACLYFQRWNRSNMQNQDTRQLQSCLMQNKTTCCCLLLLTKEFAFLNHFFKRNLWMLAVHFQLHPRYNLAFCFNYCSWWHNLPTYCLLCIDHYLIKVRIKQSALVTFINLFDSVTHATVTFDELCCWPDFKWRSVLLESNQRITSLS